MNEQTKYFLKHDICCVVDTRRIYGRKNDPVEVITKRGDIYGVRGPDNETFFVKIEDLQFQQIVEQKVESIPTEKIEKKKSAGRKRSNNSPSLF